MKADAEIIGMSTTDRFGNRVDNFKWQGGDVAIVSDYILETNGHLNNLPQLGDTIALGSLRLKVLNLDECSRSYLVTRDGPKAHLYLWLYRSLGWYRWLKPRIIYTLFIWGLAEREPGRVPGWSDIRWIGRFFNGRPE